jgi:hypothetical protein
MQGARKRQFPKKEVAFFLRIIIREVIEAVAVPS